MNFVELDYNYWLSDHAFSPALNEARSLQKSESIFGTTQIEIAPELLCRKETKSAPQTLQHQPNIFQDISYVQYPNTFGDEQVPVTSVHQFDGMMNGVAKQVQVEDVEVDASESTIESVKEVYEDISIEKVRGNKNADSSIKQILRAFRQEIKDQFIAKYGKKYYHWVPNTCRKNLKNFFTSNKDLTGFQFSEEFFARNEAVLFQMIYNTKKGQNLEKFGIESSPFSDVMEKVFGNKPNQRNRSQFFKNEVIQAFWWSIPQGMGNTSKNGFIQSEKLRSLLSELSIQERKNLKNTLEKQSPAGLTILP